MKNFWKGKSIFRIVGIIALVAVIGFGVAACKSEEEEEVVEETTTPTGGGSALDWPDGFFTRTATSGRKIGEFSPDSSSATYGQITFYAKNDSTSGTMMFGKSVNGETMYILTSVDGTTLKVKNFDNLSSPTGNEIILCTSFERTGTDRTGTLVLTGAEGNFTGIGTMTAN